MGSSHQSCVCELCYVQIDKTRLLSQVKAELFVSYVTYKQIKHYQPLHSHSSKFVSYVMHKGRIFIFIFSLESWQKTRLAAYIYIGEAIGLS